MSPTIKIDFVSDVACPWCAVGLGALEQALKKLPADTPIELRFQPFELNPRMPNGGQDILEHLSQKYGMPEAQIKANQEHIRLRAAEVGFKFHPEGRSRVYNTFHCHRLLHWAQVEFGLSAQKQLKKELLATYFTLAVDLDEPAHLLAAVERAHLDVDRAAQVLSSDEFTDEVRSLERFYSDHGIHSVPSVILNDQYLLQGAQAPEVFEKAVRQLLQA